MRSGPKEPSSAQSMVTLLIAIAVLAVGAYYLVKRYAPRSASSVAAVSSAAASSAAAEFEIVGAEHRFATSKLYSRGDFLPLDDPRGMSTGDFIGRLRALFGPVPGDEYVLRHRKTGFIITAYSAQSGPSYGGGPRHEGPLLAEAGFPSHAELLANGEERGRRVAADPILAKGRPLDLSKRPLATITPGELKELREKDHAWTKHFNDVAAPEGFAPIVARLDELLGSVEPAEWEATRYDGDTQTVYREGIRQREAFSEDLGPVEGIEFLLHEGETTDAGGGPFSADRRAVQYWLHHAKRGHRIESALPRVRAAWFRCAAGVHAESTELRAILLRGAEDDAVALGIDREKAAEALREP